MSDTPCNQEILDRISHHCPEALSTFFHCIYRADKDDNILFSRETIDLQMYGSFRIFRNNIKKLARKNLLIWSPVNDGIFITLGDRYG